MLVVAPQGGLCNRLRVLLSALHALRAVPGCGGVRVCWRAERECGARFEDLFEPPAEGRMHIGGCPYWLRPVCRKNLHLPALLRTPRFGFAQRTNFHASREDIGHLLARHRRLYVSTCYPLLDYPPAIAAELRLTPALEARVEELARQFDAHTVGLHIRRTDHRQSIARSTDAAFDKAIRQTLARDPLTRFYLATDSRETKRRLTGRYGDRILTADAPLGRDSRAGVEAAAVDLFALARTARIYGSWYSSFTDMAAEIGGLEKHVITQ